MDEIAKLFKTDYVGGTNFSGDRLLFACKYDEVFETQKWVKELKKLHIKWPNGLSVNAIPPTLGAIVRYKILDDRNKELSIYLDCYDILGCYGKPYWELYPIDDDVFRCAMKETKILINKVEEYFEL